MDPVVVHAGDDLPTLDIQLYDGSSELDLSAATTAIYAKFRLKGDDTVLATLTLAKISGGGATGWVRLTWGATTLDVDAGNYELEIYVDFNASIQTVNNYYLYGYSSDVNSTIPVQVRDDF